jgi:hypothetical protein
MRARNNLNGMIESINLEDANVVAREIYDIARRVGNTTWILQGIGVGIRVSHELGRWEDWIEESESEMPEEGADFYRLWFDGQIADREAFRGRPDEAIRVLERILRSEAARDSAQAQAGLASQMGDVLMAEQRWAEAVDATRAGWNHSDMARYATTTAMLAAVAGGDRESLEEAHRAMLAAREGPDLPASIANEHLYEALAALLEDRWDAARAAYLNAKRLLEQVGNRLLLSRLQLAVGHLAAGRFAEAADAAQEAEAFFRERGADAYVAAYHAHAARANEPAPRTAKSSGEAVRSESS